MPIRILGVGVKFFKQLLVNLKLRDQFFLKNEKGKASILLVGTAFAFLLFLFLFWTLGEVPFAVEENEVKFFFGWLISTILVFIILIALIYKSR